MRGKLVVIGLGLFAAVLLVYSLWFTNNHTPIDERFNMRRQGLDADTPGALILRERAGDYLRQSLRIDTLDTVGVGRHGAAVYHDFEGKAISLEVVLAGETPPTLRAAFEGFAERAGGASTANTVIRLHPDGRIPYGYGVYAAANYTYYEFTWLNGGWIIRVSTREAGSESLLRFANGYVY
ncbi:MAG TPA: hypothetical protein PLD47_08525 [Aggregatilineales bacterium]|nr:hypothetical protein [Anaerolineales bacterium]HRE47756.1 hypothetical protein [Aggregatilineales bacterium]